MSDRSCVPIKLYLRNQLVGHIWPRDCRLLICGPVGKTDVKDISHRYTCYYRLWLVVWRQTQDSMRGKGQRRWLWRGDVKARCWGGGDGGWGGGDSCQGPENGCTSSEPRGTELQSASVSLEAWQRLCRVLWLTRKGQFFPWHIIHTISPHLPLPKSPSTERWAVLIH